MGTYILKTQIEISAAHSLREYPGNCARIHGHNWKIVAEVKTQKLNHLGIGIDFTDLKHAIKEVVSVLDHQYINEIPPFDTINPTAENIASWFYNQLALIVNSKDIKLLAVNIFETDRSSIRYSEE